ncbi:MAG: LPS export ABC transporter permease LptG [Proteobacteria bacterium]|nr:LPS export ABC transporter permease LptG [Pseudomonadota bacterium]
MYSTLNRYIFKAISLGVLLAIAIFLSLDVLIGFISQVNVVGRGDYTIGSALFYTLLTIPDSIYQNFAVSSVVGVMLGLGALAASSELVVIQSSGVSRMKVAAVSVSTLLVWLLPMTMMGEYVVPPAKLLAESYRATKLNKDVGLGVNSGVWIRDGNIVFNATPVGSGYDERRKNIVMNDVTVYELDDKLKVVKVSKAEKATHKGGSWELLNIQVTEFVESGVVTKTIDWQLWPSRIEPEILGITHSRAKDLSIRDIVKYKNFQENKDHIPIKYDIALWSKITYPLMVIATALTGLPFLFGLLRSGGFGQRLLIGIMLGIVFNLANRTLLNMGEVFNIHPAVVTILPAATIVILTLWILKLQNR